MIGSSGPMPLTDRLPAKRQRQGDCRVLVSLTASTRSGSARSTSSRSLSRLVETMRR
jgi:hypothetical protein